MRSGTVKFFNASKGFGFVTPDGGDADIFLPAAALTASGLQSVKQGLRVTFEQAPDTKGPKVVLLKLLGEAPAKPQAPAPDRVSVYCDPGSDLAADIMNEVRSAGYQMQLHDYVGTPLAREHLQHLSYILGQAGQSLVRRYDPLFLALQLDDRFITDQDFWTAIAEHPALINGPVLLHGGKARICKSPQETRAFLGKSVDVAPAPKALSPRMAAMLKGETPAPAPAKKDAVVESPPPPKPALKPAKIPVLSVAAKAKPKAAIKSPPAKPDKKKQAAKKAPGPVGKSKKPSKK